MAGIYEKYLTGVQAGDVLGRNALARQQMLEEVQRQSQMRNILSQAFRPEVPGVAAMPEAAAMGPLQPGAEALPAYPAQAAIPAKAAGGGMAEALPEMYRRGLGPEALKLEELRRKSMGGIGTYNPRDYTPESWAEFLKTSDPGVLQRYTEKTVTIGGVEHQLIPGRGYVPLTTLQAEAEAQAKLGEAKAGAAVTGRMGGEAEALLSDLEANLPRLTEVTNQLSELGKKAAYTIPGRSLDETMRFFGLDPREAAVARREYIAKVDNEILPLLRQTFGAAFTQKEGESLKATLGDINASPKEKDAILRSFIDSKRAQIETLRRRTGKEVPRVPEVKAKYKLGQVITNKYGKKATVTGFNSDGSPVLKIMK